MAIRITIQVQLIDVGFSVQDCAVTLLQMEVPVCRLFIRVFIRVFISLLFFLFSTMAWLGLCTYRLFSLYFTQDSFIHSFTSAIFFHSLITYLFF